MELALGIGIQVWGHRALFTRPEMRAERVSYDVITPSAARGIMDAIHWKPSMMWRIQRIRVLNEIKFESVRRNEIGSKISVARGLSAMRSKSTDGLALCVDEDRQQRASTLLRDVSYVIEASVELTAQGRSNPKESVGKHIEIARRRAAQGQCFHRPYLGCREFAADFDLVKDDPPPPHSSLRGPRDLGWMLLDIDFARGVQAKFYRAVMNDGVIDVPAMNAAEVVA